MLQCSLLHGILAGPSSCAARTVRDERPSSAAAAGLPASPDFGSERMTRLVDYSSDSSSGLGANRSWMPTSRYVA